VKSKLRIDNLSDGQIDWLLDELIRRSVEPVAHTSDFLKQLVSDVFRQSFQDNRRKVSPIDRKTCYALLFEILNSSNTALHVSNFMSAKIERNLTHEALVKLTSLEGDYRRRLLVQARTGVPDPRVFAFEKMFGVKDRKAFSLALAETAFWVGEYETFRNSIVMNFEKMAWMTTNSIVRNTSLAIDRDDMYKNMMMGAQRAVDKFTSLKGTLASYVRLWFRNAETNPPFPHEYGNSFNVSAGERRRLTNKRNSGEFAITNLSVSLDEALDLAYDGPSPERMDAETRSGIFLSHLVSGTPNAVFAFLMGDIPYFLDNEQIARLESTL